MQLADLARDEVLRVTDVSEARERARLLGLKVSELDTLRDIDTIEDLDASGLDWK